MNFFVTFIYFAQAFTFYMSIFLHLPVINFTPLIRITIIGHINMYLVKNAVN